MAEVTLMSAQRQCFTVPLAVAQQSVAVRNMLDDVGTGETVPLANVDSADLAKIIEYCTYHTESKSQQLSDFEKELEALNNNDLCRLVMAVNYMDVPPLLDLACRKLGDRLRSKSAEEIRQAFGIVNDFTPEEEEEVRKEHMWAYP